MDQAYNNGAIVTGDAPISPSADALLISTDNKKAGLWLWQGQAVPRPPLSPPKSRDQQVLPRIMHAARRTGSIGLPTGFAFALIVVLVMPHSMPPERSVSADTPTVSLPPIPSDTVVRPSVAPAPAELMEAQSDQTEVPLAPAAQTLARPAETRVAKSHAQPPRTVRKTHASPVRRGPPTLMPGVLTPPSMTWRGSGY
jgi:hypothetical protein